MPLDIYELKSVPKPVSRKKTSQAGIPRHATGQLFLKGPIPLAWLSAASQQPGKALSVGIAIWFLAGCTNKPTVTLGNELCKKFGISRFAKRRGLDALVSAGLVDAEHHQGRGPLVTLRYVALGQGGATVHRQIPQSE